MEEMEIKEIEEQIMEPQRQAEAERDLALEELERLEAGMAAAILEEREACAKTAETWRDPNPNAEDCVIVLREGIAAAIRGRKP